jgi:hypothetical protein
MPPTEIPQINPAETPEDFNDAVIKVQQMISELRPLDYEALNKEMVELNIPTTDSPSLQKLQEDIQRIQSAKDRMADIIIDVEEEYRIKDCCSSLLKESWLKYSPESAVDKRKSDAALRMSQFILSSAQAEVLYKTASRVMKNLDDKQGSISRQVTIYQQLIKMRDINRGLPEGGGASSRVDAYAAISDKDLEDWEEQPN